MSRYRVTVRGSDVELRGYVDSMEVLAALADAMEPNGGVVAASPAVATYDPFDGSHEAQVWDEGYNAGCSDGEYGNHVFAPTKNPYREEKS